MITYKTPFALGDCIYLLPVIKEYQSKNRIGLITPWPNLFVEANCTNIDFYKVEPRSRTARKNIDNSLHLYSKDSPRKAISLKYDIRDLRPFHIQYRKYINNFYLDQLDKNYTREKYVVIRPATYRTQGYTSRNCKQEYIQYSIDKINSLGFETILLADIAPPDEDYVEFRPQNCSKYLEFGELNLLEMIDLIRYSSFVVGTVGFLIPMSIATGTKGIIIYGGRGLWDNPSRLTCPGSGKLYNIAPINQCMCIERFHDCKKDIDLCRIDEAINACTNN